MQAAILRAYIPALFTSVIALPISVWIIICTREILCYSLGELIIFGIVGLLIVAANLGIAHFLMHRFTIWIEKRT